MLRHETFFRTCSRVIGSLPPEFLARLAQFCGYFFFHILKVRRSLVLTNLEVVYPGLSGQRREELAAASFSNFALTVFETMAAGVRPLWQDVKLEGREHLDHALAQGKGCLILCIHLGNWEALASAVSRQVAPTHVIVKKVGEGRFNSFVVWLRRELGYDAIATHSDASSSPARQIFKALGRNEIVGFVMDQYQPGAPELPYFGYKTKTNTGLAAIWRRSGAPVVPVVIERIAPHQHRAIAWPALELSRSGDASFDILEATKRFNATMEQMVLFNPEQYFWLHDRWKWKRQSPAAQRAGAWSVSTQATK